MKADAFKKLIKEAVREVLKEELINILSENAAKQAAPRSTQQVTKYAKYEQVTPSRKTTGDPIMDLLEETRAGMTRDDYRQVFAGTSDMVTQGNPGNYTGAVHSMDTHSDIGIDISQLGFVKNASAVFNASIDKDKQRAGLI